MTIMAIDVKEEQDGSLTILWDENDPIESMLNDWTEQDFINVITERLTKVVKEHEQQQSNGNNKD